MSNEIFKSFEPVIFENSEILILGTFPSIKSRENNFYYGHPRNQFWWALAQIFGENKPLTINDKIELCRKHQIALWDVYCQSDLKGSSDLALEKSNFVLSDIYGLLDRYKNIKKVLCNGLLAYKTLNKFFDLSLPVIKLPSTSPANTKFDFEEWKENILN